MRERDYDRERGMGRDEDRGRSDWYSQRNERYREHPERQSEYYGSPYGRRDEYSNMRSRDEESSYGGHQSWRDTSGRWSPSGMQERGMSESWRDQGSYEGGFGSRAMSGGGFDYDERGHGGRFAGRSQSYQPGYQTGGYGGSHQDYGQGGLGQGQSDFGGGGSSYGRSDAGTWGNRGGYGSSGGGYLSGEGGMGSMMHGQGASGYGYGGSQSQTSRGRFSGRGPKGFQRSDERIREDVVQRLTDHPDLDAENIDVQVSGCVVTLSGTVEDRRDRRLAEEIAESVWGVSDVKNDIRSSIQAGISRQRVEESQQDREESSGRSETTSSGGSGRSETGGTSGKRRAA